MFRKRSASFSEFVTNEFQRRRICQKKKQTKISSYWLGSAEPTHANNSYRFEIFNRIDQDNIIDQIAEKQPKTAPIFIESV